MSVRSEDQPGHPPSVISRYIYASCSVGIKDSRSKMVPGWYMWIQAFFREEFVLVLPGPFTVASSSTKKETLFCSNTQNNNVDTSHGQN